MSVNDRGRCYEYSGRFLHNHPGAILIQGTYEIADGWRVGHAWIELDGLCYDWQTHGRMPGGKRSRFKMTSTTPPGILRDVYYRTRKIEVRQTFAFREACEAAVRHGYWGEWD